MRVLILGSGAREHALCWKLSQSELCEKIFISPGNGGTTKYNTDLDVTNFEEVHKFCIHEKISVIIPGSEEPIVKGISDFFASRDLYVFAPSYFAAQLEGSKQFAKQFMKNNGIPTALYANFNKDNINEAYRYIDEHPLPIVIKADGLAAGKGVFITQDRAEAKNIVKELILGNILGKAGHNIIIEEYLVGVEISIFVITDGKNWALLPSAKDYKRIGEYDTGKNTGGMGAIAPVPFAQTSFLKQVEEKVVVPTLQGLSSLNHPYKGILYLGLMNANGQPYLLEYNVRLGDPEAQVILPLLKTDLLKVINACANRKLHTMPLEWNGKYAAGIVCASQGYPDQFTTGHIIRNFEPTPDNLIFHAGTQWVEGNLQTAGGRVFTAVGIGNSLQAAIDKALVTARQIDFENKYFRKDIGSDILMMI
jgi:phosphoribosylamine--glycine ligase